MQYHLGLFKWSNGWPMSISNWGQDPPSDSCGSFNASDGRWYPTDCQTKLPYLCKYWDATPPTPGPNGECPTSAFQDLSDDSSNCYYFNLDEGVSWSEAARRCQTMGHGAALASIHSPEEMSLITGQLTLRQVTAWIGLFTTADNNLIQYFWSDHSAVDFTNWEEGEPNNSDNELCVQAYGHNGKWNDAPCEPISGYGNGYICKAPKGKIFMDRSRSAG